MSIKCLNILCQPANGTPIRPAHFNVFTKAIGLVGGHHGGLRTSGLGLIIALLITVPSAWGQGAIGLQNIGTGANGTSVNAPVLNSDGTPLAGGGFSAQLFAGPAASGPFTAAGNPVAFLSATFGGYFFASTTITIPGFPTGSRPILILRAWDNAGGTITNYSNATVRGQSAPFVSPPLGDSFTPPTIPVPQGLTSFKLRNNALPPTQVAAVSGSVTLNIPTDAAQAYRVEWSDNLSSWNTLSNFTSSNVVFQLMDQAITVTNRRFYRTVELR